MGCALSLAEVIVLQRRGVTDRNDLKATTYQRRRLPPSPPTQRQFTRQHEDSPHKSAHNCSRPFPCAVHVLAAASRRQPTLEHSRPLSTCALVGAKPWASRPVRLGGHQHWHFNTRAEASRGNINKVLAYPAQPGWRHESVLHSVAFREVLHCTHARSRCPTTTQTRGPTWP